MELASSEASRCREEAEETREKIRMIEMENKMLVDRWMELKITEAEKVNEVREQKFKGFNLEMFLF